MNKPSHSSACVENWVEPLSAIVITVSSRASYDLGGRIKRHSFLREWGWPFASVTYFFWIKCVPFSWVLGVQREYLYRCKGGFQTDLQCWNVSIRHPVVGRPINFVGNYFSWGNTKTPVSDWCCGSFYLLKHWSIGIKVTALGHWKFKAIGCSSLDRCKIVCWKT